MPTSSRSLSLLLAFAAIAGCASGAGDPVGAGGAGSTQGGTDAGAGPGTDAGSGAAPGTDPGAGGSGGAAGSVATRTFAPYIDVSLSASQHLLDIQRASGVRAFTLAFVVDGGSCQATWGGLGQAISNDLLADGATIRSLVQGLQAAGVEVIVSFGGANGVDLSAACATVEQVQAMYQSVIDRYGVTMLDFDIEGWAASRQPAVDLRNAAVKALKAANPGLVVSYTLPVLPTGLVQPGLDVLAAVRSSGLTLDVVNVMAMDYGAALDGGDMGASAVQAATATLAQLRAAGLDANLGITPMIGVNDVSSEVFRLQDAATLLEFARGNARVSRLSMWSVSRDHGDCPGQAWASPVCSGVVQDDYAFTRVLGGLMP